ncbi:hypothetical protein PC114_g14772 [Phytophthora cactorum]|nr:hypothetical protein PC114_g14772 [Phytophthora cactorum]
MFPGEIMLSLLKSKTMETNPVGRREVTCPSPKGMYGGAPECADFGLQMNRRSGETHQLWARRTEKLIPILLTNRRGDPVKLGFRTGTFHVESAMSILHPSVIRIDRLGSRPTLTRRPPGLSDPDWHTPKECACRMAKTDLARDDGVPAVAVGFAAVNAGYEATSGNSRNVGRSVASLAGDEDPRNRPKETGDYATHCSVESDTVTRLEGTFVSVIRVVEAEEDQDSDNRGVLYDHLAAETRLEDYAHELAYLPDLNEASPTPLYSASNVQDEYTSNKQSRLVIMLQRHERIMIASGNTLPPPAYETVCGIDV